MSSTTFREFSAAARTVAVVERIVARWMDRNRPRYRYATVVSIDRPNRTCLVTFAGDDGDAVPVGMGGVQPLNVGVTVRIDGLQGDRFITDVMGPVHIVTS